MNNLQEYIVSSAYKLKKEYNVFPEERRIIYKHEKIREEYGLKDDIYNIRIGRHHAEILHLFSKEVDHNTDGFYTSWGRWVNRYDAAKIAIACGQCKEGRLIMGNRLDSSDIFK